MKNVVKSGIGALLVGGLMVSGLGVFSAGEGSIKTAEAAVPNPSKSPGSKVYSKYVGKTQRIGKEAYREFNVTSWGIVDSIGKRAKFDLVFSSKYKEYATHKVLVYKLSDDKKTWEATRFSPISVSEKSQVFTVYGGMTSGTYFAKITTTVKDSKGKTKTYMSKTNAFTHSDKLK